MRVATSLAVVVICLGRHAAAASDRPLVKVGAVAITEQQVAQRVRQLLPTVSFHRQLTPALLARLSKTARDELIEEELLFLEATRRGLVPTDDAVRKERERLIARAGGPRKFAARLDRARLSWKDHWLELRRRMATRKVLDTLDAHTAARTDDQVKAYYAANRMKFKLPPEVRLVRAVIAVKAGSPSRAWQQAQKRAQALHRHLLAGGRDQATKTLAHLARHDPAISQSDTGWVHRGRLEDALDREAFRLEVGQLSAPIRTLRGYEIIEVKGRRPGKQMTYAELATKLRKELEQRQRAHRRRELLERLRAEVPVVELH